MLGPLGERAAEIELDPRKTPAAASSQSRDRGIGFCVDLSYLEAISSTPERSIYHRLS